MLRICCVSGSPCNRPSTFSPLLDFSCRLSIYHCGAGKWLLSLGRAKICLILTRGHERVGNERSLSERASERGRVEFKFTRILRARGKIRRKNRRGLSTYRQDAVDTGSHTEMPHTIFRYLLCEPPIIWEEKERSRIVALIGIFRPGRARAVEFPLRTGIRFTRSSSRLSSNAENTFVAANNARYK